MRILLNALSALGQRSGIGHYTAELLRCLTGELGEDEHLVARPRPWVGWLRRGKVSPPDRGAETRANWKKRLVSWLKPAGRALLRWHFAAVARLGRFDVYHEPNYVPAPCSVPTIATIHDLSVLLHPEWHPADRVAWFERNFQRMQKQCVHYLTVSEAARQEIIATLGIPPARVTRTYNGVRPWLRPMTDTEVQPVLQRLGLPRQYVLYVGTIEPRKNVLTLLHAYCDLPAPLRTRYPLVLAGGWGWKADDVAAYF